MQHVLLRENKIDHEKEHFWIIGMNYCDYILYIELIVLGLYKSVNVKPIKVYHVSMMINVSCIILIHNHQSRSLIPSEAVKDTTDRLIQVSQISNINLVDHLIITPKNHISFASIKLMNELKQSLKYVLNGKLSNNKL